MNEIIVNFQCASVASLLCAVVSYPFDTIKVFQILVLTNQLTNNEFSPTCNMITRNSKVFLEVHL